MGDITRIIAALALFAVLVLVVLGAWSVFLDMAAARFVEVLAPVNAGLGEIRDELRGLRDDVQSLRLP